MLDWTGEELRQLLEIAVEVKANPERYSTALAGQTLFLYFEKPSLRTRVTFEAGMFELGGHAIHYSINEGRIGVRESVEDVARNLERWVDGVMCRTFAHSLVADLARFAEIPVINGLTDRLHPCQALADFMTLEEVRGPLAGRHLAYVGDGNNVAHSLLEAGARFGVHVSIVTPAGHGPDPEILEACSEAARATGARLRTGSDIALVDGADAVYTDVWASMGQEAESEARKRSFAPYQVNDALMARASQDAIFMHCLPAHRGDEVTDSVADSPQSVIFEQAENRLHAQKAILLAVMGGLG
jgi:ornithine carbamoyltransferase